MGKDSVCWSWDERLKEKGRKSYARHCGLRNQMFSLSCALFNDESPLVSWKLFSYFKNCPHFHKESLRHTQHYTVKRTITVERNWFNPSKQMKTTSRLRLPITSALICWNPLYLNHAGWSHFRANQSIPQVKAMVWHLAAWEPAALQVENFSKGNFGCI